MLVLDVPVDEPAAVSEKYLDVLLELRDSLLDTADRLVGPAHSDLGASDRPEQRGLLVAAAASGEALHHLDLPLAGRLDRRLLGFPPRGLAFSLGIDCGPLSLLLFGLPKDLLVDRLPLRRVLDLRLIPGEGGVNLW
jgi:hypothetical protein